MPELVLHPSVELALSNYLVQPAHALLLIGEPGTGKGSLLTYLAARLLECDEASLENTAGFLNITGEAHIGIDEIRKIQHFLALKPAKAGHSRRVICIEDAGRMTTEAQNALLKSIEEPPADSFLLLSATSVNQLLPTIMSRVQPLNISRPDMDTLKQYYINKGVPKTDVDRAYVMAGGLPGAMESLLSGDPNHPVLQATEIARSLLQAGKFERLTSIEPLAKDRETAIRVCGVLAHMAEISLRREGITPAQSERWQSVLAASTFAADKLRVNAQAKLTLTGMSLQM